MYALFFFWFPYCRDKVVAFGAFRCDLHLSGGIRPYVQQASAASWASQLFHRVFIFFRNHFPPSFGCLCRKGTGQIIPVPFSFVAQGRGVSRNALLCISSAYSSPSGHCLPFSSSLFLPIQNLMCSAFMYGYLLQCSFRLSVFLLFHTFPGNFHGIGYMQALRKVHGLNIHKLHVIPLNRKRNVYGQPVNSIFLNITEYGFDHTHGNR